MPGRFGPFMDMGRAHGRTAPPARARCRSARDAHGVSAYSRDAKSRLPSQLISMITETLALAETLVRPGVPGFP
jgi:hypothetical protein